MSDRTMYDSTQPDKIPMTVKMAAGYIDGTQTHGVYAELARHLPDAHKVKITVVGTPGAHVCDTEPGNVGVPGTLNWLKDEYAAERIPSVYCSLSTVPAVLKGIIADALPRTTPFWTAHPTGTPHLCDAHCFASAGITVPFQPNVAATQYAWPDQGHSGGPWDLSLVAPYWPGVDPPPPVVGPLPSWWHRPLHLGMVGVDVLHLKWRLRELGYHHNSTLPPFRFMFGSGVRRDLVAFQTHERMTVTGRCGAPTARRLRNPR